LLDLEDEPRPILREHLGEAAARRARGRSSGVERHPIESRGKLLTLVGGNLSEHARRFIHGSPRYSGRAPWPLCPKEERRERVSPHLSGWRLGRRCEEARRHSGL